MKKCKQVKFIKGNDLSDLETKINEALMNGAEFGGIDISSLTGAVVVTEYVGDLQKTALDKLEDEFGRHNCAECPFLELSSDKRTKWHNCTKYGKKVTKGSRCCTAYFELLREEVQSELSEDQRENERVRFECGGCSGVAQGITASGVRSLERTEQIPTIGMRIPVKIPSHTARRIV